MIVQPSRRGYRPPNQCSKLAENKLARAKRHIAASFVEPLEERTLFSTFTVTTNSDVPIPLQTTLREAIMESNLAGGSNTIDFNLPPGQTTIQPLIPLPAVTAPTLIDGTSQPLYAGTPIVWIEATPTSAGSNGLTLNAANSGVKGIAITGFSGGAGVELAGANGLVDSDYLGLDPSGGTPATVSANAEANQNGASADGTGAIIRNSVLSNNDNAGLQVTGSGALITGNRVGTDPTGNQQRGNNVAGIYLTNAANVTIGGTTAAARNIVSGNFLDGIAVADPGTGDVIAGNYIGLDSSGANATVTGNQGNGIFVSVTTAGTTTGLTIGGTSSGARNAISGNQGDGIHLESASGNTISGNYIGTDSTGQNNVGNQGSGINIIGTTSNNTIGGAGSAGNVISGNSGDGVTFSTDATTTGNSVNGNLIGTNASGNAAIPNAGNGVTASSNITIGAANAGNTISGNLGAGVELDGSGNVLGYDSIGIQSGNPSGALGNHGDGVRVLGHDNVIGTPSSGNTIAYNGGNGVTVGLSSTAVTVINNSIRGNNIYLNTKLGIDLGNDGVTLNDPGDADEGPNHLQNFPVLTSVTLSGSTATITGTLNSTPLSTFAIDFFASQIWDPTHYGEGQKYLGSITVTTDASGNASFTATMPGVPAGYNYFASTATDARGNTSEFDYDPLAGSEPGRSRHPGRRDNKVRDALAHPPQRD